LDTNNKAKENIRHQRFAGKQHELKNRIFSEKAQITSIIWGRKLITFLELQSEKIELDTKWKCTRHSGSKIRSLRMEGVGRQRENCLHEEGKVNGFAQ
jgi:hypothetical protein